MDDFISNIELIDDSILITYYFTDKKIKIPYNDTNRLTTLNNINDSKDFIKYELRELFKLKRILPIINTVNIGFNILIYFLSNNILIDLITTLISLEMTYLFYLFNKYLKISIDNFNNLLESTFSKKLPKEEKYLYSQKVIDFLEYRKKKKKKEINLYYYDNKEDMGKVLKFKK